MKVSVMSGAYDIPIKRGITTAVQWINPDLGFFRPTEIKLALAHVELETQLDRIWLEYQALDKRLGPLPVMKAVGATIATATGAISRQDSGSARATRARRDRLRRTAEHAA